MKKLIITLLVLCFSSGPLGSHLFGRARTGPSVRSPIWIKALQAHGVDRLPSTLAFRAAFKKIIPTPGQVVERDVEFSVEGEKVKQRSSDPLGKLVRYDVIDGSGGLSSVSVSKSRDGASLSERLPTDEATLRTIKFNRLTCGLLPLLQEFSKPTTEAYLLERTSDMLDKFNVSTPDDEWAVYLDQSGLIRKIERRNLVMQFADYNLVSGINLPFYQRVSIGSRLAYEKLFHRIEISPRFASTYFGPEFHGAEAAN
jgi:hypothetical protein